MNSAEQPTCRLKAGAVVYQSTVLEASLSRWPMIMEMTSTGSLCQSLPIVVLSIVLWFEGVAMMSDIVGSTRYSGRKLVPSSEQSERLYPVS